MHGTTYMAIDTATLENSELEKYILLLVYVDGEPIYGRQKLQLMMYMLGDSYPEIRDWCNYTVRDDGPYSTVLDDTLKHLVQMEMLDENNDTIQLTRHSMNYARVIGEEKGGFPEIEDAFNPTMVWVFHNHKHVINSVTIPEALSFLYCRYPDMTKGSTTYEKLKPNIKEYIISMYAKERFSFGRAAELLGIPKHVIMDELAKRKLLRFGN